MFEYPLTLKFATEEVHIKHITDYQSFYRTILNRCANDSSTTEDVCFLESQLEESKLKAEAATNEAQENKLKEEAATKEAQENKLKEEAATKEAQENKLKEEAATKEAQENKLKEEAATKEAQENKLKEEAATKEARENKLKAEAATKEAQEYKLKAEAATKEAQENKLKAEAATKEAQEIKKINKSQEEKVKNADSLIGQKRKHEEMESPSTGKIFESLIVYALTSDKKLMDMPCTVDKTNKRKACNIRLDVAGLGVVGIEATKKVKISNSNDMSKFLRDRVDNNFVASIFWSKTASIPNLNDDGDENDDFYHVKDNVLYIRSIHFKQSVYIIYVYLLTLKTSRATTGASSQFICTMFDMLTNHYTLFRNLKKEVRILDKTLLNDIKNIESMCQQELDLNSPKMTKVNIKGHLYLVCKKNTNNDELKFYENKAMQSNKITLSSNGKKKKAWEEVVAIDDSSNGIMKGTGEEVVAMDDERIQSDHIVTSGDQKFSG